VNPGAAETCDGFDENCDGVIDDGSAGCPCDVVWNADSAYMICTAAADWTTAQAGCRTFGYHLASIGDSGEDAFVDGTIDTYSTTTTWWIGLNDRRREGTFLWEDGSSVAYTNWATGQPDNAGGADCAALNAVSGGSWADEACTASAFTVCEAP
jgi:C-type mannose receptor